MSGVLGPERLTALYGIDAGEANLGNLMRHRAVLFGLLGTFLLVAAFRPPRQGLARLAGWISVLSFLWLAWSTGGDNDFVRRVIIADLVAVAALVTGTVAWFVVPSAR